MIRMKSRVGLLNAIALCLFAFWAFSATPAFADDYTCTCTSKGGAGCPSQSALLPTKFTAKDDAEAQPKCSADCSSKLSAACLDSFSFAAASKSNLLITGKNCPDGKVCLQNPLDRCPDNTDPAAACHTLTVPGLVANILKTAIGIVGALALLMFIYGGLRWLTSAGEPAKIQAGKDAMKWAAIGLVIIFSSYTLVSFVFKALTG